MQWAVLAELDAQSHADTNQSKHKLARDFAMLWDTAGWVFFQSGDYNRAESCLRALLLALPAEMVGEGHTGIGGNAHTHHLLDLVGRDQIVKERVSALPT